MIVPALSMKVFASDWRHRSPFDLGRRACLAIGQRRTEVFAAMFLNRRLRVLGAGTFTEHDPLGVDVPIGDILRKADDINAAFVIMAHNHPSGDPNPSRADIAVTLRFARMSEDCGLTLMDHFIVGGTRWTSMRMLGLLG